MIIQQLVVILVLSQEGIRTCPSTPPSGTNLQVYGFKHFLYFGSLKFLTPGQTTLLNFRLSYPTAF